MIDLLVCGFQTGADIGGARAAKALGIPTDGWMPRGYLTEDGPRPDYATEFGAREHESPDYPPRTRANVALADLSLIFNVGEHWSRGTRLAAGAAQEQRKPFAVVELTRTPRGFTVDNLTRPGSIRLIWWHVSDNADAVARIRGHIEREGVGSLNVAGNRESTTRGIGAWVEAFMVEVLRPTDSTKV